MIHHLLYFNDCFYCVLEISDFNSVSFTLLELFDEFLVESLLCNAFCVGFYLVGLSVEFEFNVFALNQFSVDFEFCLQGKFLGCLFDCDLAC